MTEEKRGGLLKRYKRWRLRRKIRTAVRLMISIDHAMIRLGWPHYQRKQVWKEFIKSRHGRESVIDVLKEV